MLFTDHLNNTIDLQSFPKRIISLVPSQTELLWDLGLREELVGITKFCIHPKELFHSAPRIGGTKKFNFKKIRELKPDLIIGNKEENEQKQIEALQKEFTIWMSDIYTLEDALKTINDIGELVNKKEEAGVISHNIKHSFVELKKIHKRVLYLIWKDPYMAAGKATFIGDILSRIGMENVFEDKNSRYPEVTISDMQNLDPELILLSSEPYPFKEKHMKELQDLLPNTQIILVDGELFSWYGSRLLKSVKYFNELGADIS